MTVGLDDQALFGWSEDTGLVMIARRAVTSMPELLEVAQIARSICRVLRLDEDLAEALALAHDLGHTPFGHAGEEALDHAALRVLRPALAVCVSRSSSARPLSTA